jgi:hypothetical protein
LALRTILRMHDRSWRPLKSARQLRTPCAA